MSGSLHTRLSGVKKLMLRVILDPSTVGEHRTEHSRPTPFKSGITTYDSATQGRC